MDESCSYVYVTSVTFYMYTRGLLFINEPYLLLKRGLRKRQLSETGSKEFDSQINNYEKNIITRFKMLYRPK